MGGFWWAVFGGDFVWAVFGGRFLVGGFWWAPNTPVRVRALGRIFGAAARRALIRPCGIVAVPYYPPPFRQLGDELPLL